MRRALPAPRIQMCFRSSSSARGRTSRRRSVRIFRTLAVRIFRTRNRLSLYCPVRSLETSGAVAVLPPALHSRRRPGRPSAPWSDVGAAQRSSLWVRTCGEGWRFLWCFRHLLAAESPHSMYWNDPASAGVFDVRRRTALERRVAELRLVPVLSEFRYRPSGGREFRSVGSCGRGRLGHTRFDGRPIHSMSCSGHAVNQVPARKSRTETRTYRAREYDNVITKQDKARLARPTIT